MRTLLITVIRLTRLNVWKIIPIPERISRKSDDEAPRTSRPFTLTEPSTMGTRPFTARNIVDLPAPDNPTTTTNSPGWIVSVTLSSARNPPG